MDRVGQPCLSATAEAQKAVAAQFTRLDAFLSQANLVLKGRRMPGDPLALGAYWKDKAAGLWGFEGWGQQHPPQQIPSARSKGRQAWRTTFA